ncbi:hypothetical protein Y694_04729 [Methylibium sp. T29-B]|nr:hypothetical protein Y694_04729 [Methylibium sp. T29-B]
MMKFMEVATPSIPFRRELEAPRNHSSALQTPVGCTANAVPGRTFSPLAADHLKTPSGLVRLMAKAW